MIASALFTPAQQKLLGLLFMRVNEGFHLNEIMRLTGLGSASAQRELKRLHEAGLIVSERIGNVRQFRPNKQNIVYEELTSIVKKTFGLVSVLNSALAPMRKSLNVAFVYGKTAKEQEASSDAIELLLIGENTTYGELLSRLPVAERLLRRKVNPNLYSLPDFHRRLREQQGFILNVLSERKIFVLGDETDLDDVVRGAVEEASR
ncbi:transcriptional regulator [Pseudoduganella armeniaca]|uniref:Transcriptional regulator n=1 Tax=Pseudoduganella armeniaca TaxID=2072590 RepID=A0A2R4CIN3_9BURK|nr:transcriptional regulator [Pseudoduganella armeniaca]AVR99412.1 transcriptional regulator [Pseudoduganella armeniaca]